MSDQYLQSLESLIRIFGRTYYPDEVIFYEDDSAREAFFIVKGSVKVSTKYNIVDQAAGKEIAKGKSYQLCHLSTGDVFGEMALLNETTRSATATALEETEVLVMNQNDFFANIERYPQLAVRVLKVLSNRLRQMDDKLRETLGYVGYLEYQLEMLKNRTPLK